MKNKVNKLGMKLFIFLTLFFIFVSTALTQTQSCDSIVTGVPSPAQTCTYTKNNAGVSGNGPQGRISCDGNDIKISCRDSGHGKNHGCDDIGGNSCRAWEGSKNYGVAGCIITCEKSLCELRGAGCYKKVDEPIGFGSVPPNEFDYYLPNDKCIQQEDSCDCQQYPDNIAEQTDADDSTESCSCIEVSAWIDTVNKCCGDDTTDDPDWDQKSCDTCPIGNNIGTRIWEPNKGCCGDDTLAEDDPDWGEISCNSCPLGNNTETRVWDSAINKCCGDDTLAEDNPDEGEISCLSCPIGNNQGNRIWSTAVTQCCGDDTIDCSGPTREEDDPDWDKASCLGCQVGQNMGSRDWYDNGGCCGDDLSDCARLAGEGICSLDSYNQTPFWLSSSLFEGDIRYIPCANQEYLANDTTWNACDGAFWLKTIDENDYLCSKKGQQSIVECCGDEGCNSVTDGKRLTTGQSVIPIDKSTPFTTPLDNTQCGRGNVTNQTNPSCTVSFNPSSGVSGTNTAYTWSSTNDADGQIPYSCTGSLGSATLNGANGSGTIAIPQDTQTCTFTVVNSVGTSATCQATITVTETDPNNKDLSKGKVLADQPGMEAYVCNPPKSGEPSFVQPFATKLASSTMLWGANDEFTNPDDGNNCLSIARGIKFPAMNNEFLILYYKEDGTAQTGEDIFVEVNGQKFLLPDHGASHTGYKEERVGPFTLAAGTYDILFSAGPDGAGLGPSDCSQCGGSVTLTGGYIRLDSTTSHTGDVVFNTLLATDEKNFKQYSLPLGSVTGFATATVTNTTGGNVTGSEANKTYYCRVDAKFVKDLDTPWAQASDTELNNKNKVTCEKAGFNWTGTKCCSEADDPNEYYNDPGTIGGCWNKKFIQSVSFVNGTNNSVINYEGSFHGCAIDQTIFNRDNDNLLNLKDQHTQGQLITNHQYCFNEPQGIYYCSYKEKWLLNDINRTHLSYSPLNTPNTNSTLTAECCPTNQCWDGSSCIENQKDDPLAQPINGLRCIDGEWEKANLKFTSDGSVSGYCPKLTQCLVNPFAKNESEQCIDSGKYVIKPGPYTLDDNYCENGQWTSRTKLLALKLMKMKSGSYTLFCDTEENTLNNLNYIVGNDSNQIAANILINFKTNNFCVLKSGNNILIGTTININIENVSSSNLNIFGVTSCRITTGDISQYNPCDQSRKVWYNKNLRSLIFSQSAIRIPSDSNYLDSFDQFIGTPINNIINTIKRLITTPPADESYVDAFKRFDRLYFTEQNNRSVIGAIDGISYHNAVVEYKSLTTDICNFVEQFNAAKKDVYSGVACKKEYNNYYVLAQGDKFTSLDPYSIWPDLTAKIRLT